GPRPDPQEGLADPMEPDASHLLRVEDPAAVDDDRRGHRRHEVLRGEAREGRPVPLEDCAVCTCEGFLDAVDDLDLGYDLRERRARERMVADHQRPFLEQGQGAREGGGLTYVALVPLDGEADGRVPCHSHAPMW